MKRRGGTRTDKARQENRKTRQEKTRPDKTITRLEKGYCQYLYDKKPRQDKVDERTQDKTR